MTTQIRGEEMGNSEKQKLERCIKCSKSTEADDFQGGTELYCSLHGYPCDMIIQCLYISDDTQMTKILTENLDTTPYTGIRNVKGKLRIDKTNKHLDGYFNGDENYEQVGDWVTRGKEYEVVSVEGLGDCEDVTIIDDTGELITLADFFFER